MTCISDVRSKRALTAKSRHVETLTNPLTQSPLGTAVAIEGDVCKVTNR